MVSLLILLKSQKVREGTLINGGFFVLSPEVLKKITGDDCVWEKTPLTRISKREGIDGL